ncbi:hypothetical protein TRICI_002073 [Trichomonascus ciferrii]|uniref:Transcription activator GCR1-like domain-containing protein n=1 Tax=Trichomonascus ciferrii TaxID=44093 RepID=A0A642V7M9_9ASCO|nr:hypothetical protein TRICI_002073 [Trichomonascus ciferrii]
MSTRVRGGKQIVGEEVERDEEADKGLDVVGKERLDAHSEIVRLANLQQEEEDDVWAEKAAGLLGNPEAESLVRQRIRDEPPQPYADFKRRYTAWCEKVYDGDCTVSQEKAVRFIVEDYIQKRNLRGLILKASVVENVCNFLVDIFQEQVAGEGYPNAQHPRGFAMNQLIKLHKIQSAEIDRISDRVRAGGTLEDGCDQIETMLSDLLNSQKTSHLRTRLSFLLDHSTLFRECNISSLELADLSCTVTKTEDPTPFVVYNMLTQHGKTDEMGRKDFSATLRHKDPRLCLVNALAMFLFYRFQMTREGLPDMSSRMSWYGVKLIIPLHCRSVTDNKGNFSIGSAPLDNTKEIVQTPGQETRMYAPNKVQRLWTTHNKAPGAQCLPQLGVHDPRSSWNYTSVAKRYLYTGTQSVLRAQAGFSDRVGTYFIARDTVEPPEELLQQVFPGIEEKLAELESRVNPDCETEENLRLQEVMANGLTSAERLKIQHHLQEIKDSCEQEDEPRETDLAAVHFLKMLLMLRRVLLQDMAVLSEQFPNNILLVHPVFQSHAFQVFAQRVRDAHRTRFDEQPVSEQFYKVYSELCGQLRGIKKTSVDINKAVERIDGRTSRMEISLVETDHRIERLEKAMERLKVTFESELEDIQQLILNERRKIKDSVTTDVCRALNVDPERVRVLNRRKRVDEPVVRAKAPRLQQPAPYFAFSRSHDDVRLLWNEWTKNSPCVESMDEDYGASWRVGREKKFYHRRKPIVDGIRKTIESYGRTEEEALCDAKKCQDSLTSKSLHQLARVVKKNLELGNVPPFSPWDKSKGPLPEF